ncbi:Os08g0255380 [Oryza sativa Japonica Group]|uniref:Os08g0255380 protein n=1 Tax=Oryza sativa subsp. japonica TaxID=39947 RepID=A0A0P0XDW2_ORYSJ|nr:Os08g0255380 [Oryza sativa Japonica Group]
MQERADGNVRQHAHLRHPPVSTTLRPLACLVPLWQPLAGVAQRPEKPHTVVDGKEKEQGKGKAPALASRGCTRQVAAAAAQVKLALPPRCRHGARTRPARAELADASPTHAAAVGDPSPRAWPATPPPRAPSSPTPLAPTTSGKGDRWIWPSVRRERHRHASYEDSDGAPQALL